MSFGLAKRNPTYRCRPGHVGLCPGTNPICAIGVRGNIYPKRFVERDQGGYVKGFAQEGMTDLGHAPLTFDAAAGLMPARYSRGNGTPVKHGLERTCATTPRRRRHIPNATATDVLGNAIGDMWPIRTPISAARALPCFSGISDSHIRYIMIAITVA